MVYLCNVNLLFAHNEKRDTAVGAAEKRPSLEHQRYVNNVCHFAGNRLRVSIRQRQKDK